MLITDKLLAVLRRLIAWQQQPIAPAATTTEETVCQNCGTTFRANYCPRCGQSAATRRLTPHNMLRSFLDTWGLGSHSLLRTLWHLLARPGYMIGDYIDGRRQPYFPPFKTLFIVGTAYALVFALGGGFSEAAQQERLHSMEIDKVISEATVRTDTLQLTTAEQQQQERMEEQLHSDMLAMSRYYDQYADWQQRHRVADQLLMHLVFALIAWRLFRRAPRRPGMLPSEHVVAQVYVCAQMGAVATALMLLQMPFVPYVSGAMPAGLSLLLFAYDFKQLYGYGLWRTLWKTLLMHLLFFLLLVLIFAAVIIAVGFHVGYAAAG